MNADLLGGGISPNLPPQGKDQYNGGGRSNVGMYHHEANKQACKLNKNIEDMLDKISDCDFVISCLKEGNGISISPDGTISLTDTIDNVTTGGTFNVNTGVITLVDNDPATPDVTFIVDIPGVIEDQLAAIAAGDPNALPSFCAAVQACVNDATDYIIVPDSAFADPCQPTVAEIQDYINATNPDDIETTIYQTTCGLVFNYIDNQPVFHKSCCPDPSTEIPASAFADSDNPLNTEVVAWILANGPFNPGTVFWMGGDVNNTDRSRYFDGATVVEIDDPIVTQVSLRELASDTCSLELVVDGSSAGVVGKPNQLRSPSSVTGNSTGTFTDVELRGENDTGALDTPTASVAQKVMREHNIVPSGNDCVLVERISVENYVEDTLFVDDQYGDDATALRERRDKPFKTFAAAFAEHENEDRIYIIRMDGTTGNVTLTDTLYIEFQEGAEWNTESIFINGGELHIENAFINSTGKNDERINITGDNSKLRVKNSLFKRNGASRGILGISGDLSGVNVDMDIAIDDVSTPASGQHAPVAINGNLTDLNLTVNMRNEGKKILTNGIIVNGNLTDSNIYFRLDGNIIATEGSSNFTYLNGVMTRLVMTSIIDGTITNLDGAGRFDVFDLNENNSDFIDCDISVTVTGDVRVLGNTEALIWMRMNGPEKSINNRVTINLKSVHSSTGIIYIREMHNSKITINGTRFLSNSGVSIILGTNNCVSGEENHTIINVPYIHNLHPNSNISTATGYGITTGTAIGIVNGMGILDIYSKEITSQANEPFGHDNGTNTVVDWNNEMNSFGTKWERGITANLSPSIREGVMVVDVFPGNIQGVKIKFYNGSVLYMADTTNSNRLIRRKSNGGGGSKYYAYNYVMGNQTPGNLGVALVTGTFDNTYIE